MLLTFTVIIVCQRMGSNGLRPRRKHEQTNDERTNDKRTSRLHLHGLPLMMTLFPLPFCAGELPSSISGTGPDRVWTQNDVACRQLPWLQINCG